MSSNAIASASVMLTANADGLTDGLDDAADKVESFADGQKSKSDSGGFLSGLIFGGGIGAGIEIVSKVAEIIGAIVEKLTDAEQQKKIGLDEGSATGINNAVAAFDDLQNTASRVAGVIMGNFAPMFISATEAVASAIEELEPVLEWVSRLVGAIGFVFVEVGSTIMGAIWDVVEMIGEWIGSWTGLSETTYTVEGVVLNVCEAIGKALAYVWDTLKAGAGAMAYVGSYIVDGFAKLVDAFKDTIKDLLNLAGKLPNSLGGQMFRDAAGSVDGLSSRIHAAAEDMRKWGKGTFKNFGESAKQVEKYFDGLRSKYDEAKEAKEEAARPDKFAGAVFDDSSAAYSIVAKYKAMDAGGGASSPAVRQLDESRQQTVLLRRIDDKLSNNAVAII